MDDEFLPDLEEVTMHYFPGDGSAYFVKGIQIMDEDENKQSWQKDLEDMRRYIDRKKEPEDG